MLNSVPFGKITSNEMDLSLVFKTVIIICFLIPIGGEKYIRLANCDCVVNDEYLNLTKCNLKAISREKVLGNVEYFVIKQFFNATMHLQVLKKSSSGQFYPFLFNYWANVCETVKESPKLGFIVKQAKRIMQKFSNAVKCEGQV